MQTESVEKRLPGKKNITVFQLEKYTAPVINGWERKWVDLRVKLTFVRIALRCYKSPIKAVRAIRKVLAFKEAVNGRKGIRRCVKISGKYYFSMYIPGYPSALFNRYIQTELYRIAPHQLPVNNLQVLQLAITTRCPLKCEHCFEWKNLNQEDPFSTGELIQLVKKFGAEGLAQLHLTGGEPLTKASRLIEMIRSCARDHEIYILSSGVNLTRKNAEAIKKAGATGVIISLDHTDPDKHNRFRGTPSSYNNALSAISNARQAGLVTALSICVTRDFISPENLIAYSNLAKDLGVGFIQLLEPKAVGHYAGKEIELHKEELEVIEKFYLTVNHSPEFREYPVILYHGYHQRRLGCMSAGNRILYIDAAGKIDACPFCQTHSYDAAAVIKGVLSVKDLKMSGCPSYSNQ